MVNLHHRHHYNDVFWTFTSSFIFFILLILCFFHGSAVSTSYTEFSISSFQQHQHEHQDEDFAPDSETLQWSESARNEVGEMILTVNIMHRDSHNSPLRSQNASETDLFAEMLERDGARVKSLTARVNQNASGKVKTVNNLNVEKQNASSSDESLENDKAQRLQARRNHRGYAYGYSSPVVSGLKQGSGEYFTRIGVGTPAKPLFMVLDTGSDILWMQCARCVHCYHQSDPIFNPRASRTFRKLPCSSSSCRTLQSHQCEPRTGTCIYEVSYGDGSFTEGDFATETLTFGAAAVPAIAIGCGHDNEGLFAGAGGLLGLGTGPLSLPSQMSSNGGRHSHGSIKRVFSYCLMERSRRGFSKLTLGAINTHTQFTPLLKNPILNTFYFVGLTGISVGGTLVNIPPNAFRMDSSGNGGVIVDCGTSVTRLVEIAYDPLRSAFREVTRGLPFVGGFSLFDTCYNLSGIRSVRVPTLALHFSGGLTMSLPPANYLVQVDSDGTHCLAFASTSSALNIIGNIQQQGFQMIFDNVRSRLGVIPNQC